MAQFLGFIGSYDDRKESFGDYCGRFEAFVAANEVPAARQAAAFLATVGPETYRLLKSLCHPNDPSTRTYNQMKEVIQGHYAPAPIVIAERHKFWTASQNEHESVSDFVVRLKKLAGTCNFENFEEQALRDRLVSGLHQKMAKTQRNLLSQRDLTYARARDAAVADELAYKANKETMSETTHRVQTGRKTSSTSTTSTSTTNASKKMDSVTCFCCGASGHKRPDCFFKDAKCFCCGKKGHVKALCTKKKTDQKQQKKNFKTQNNVVTEHDDHDVIDVDVCDSNNLMGIYELNSMHHVEPFRVEVEIANRKTVMEIDTGASKSTINESVFRGIQSSQSGVGLEKCTIPLKSYTGEQVPVLGKLKTPIRCLGQTCTAEIIVVKGMRPSLLGRDLLSSLKLDLTKICKIQVHSVSDDFESVLNEYTSLFSEGSTGIKGFKATLKLKDGAKIFQKDRPVPYSMVEAVEGEYDRLIRLGILEPVSHSGWASPVVHVRGKSGKIRVCGDYRRVNETIEDDCYKLPNVTDMFAKLTMDGLNPVWFSVIDLSGAFNQLILDEEASEILTLNTSRGLLRPKRLSFGVKTAPAQFQIIDTILAGMKNVMVRVDDILVSTVSKEDHLQTLKEVLRRLQVSNVRVNKGKCKFFQKSVKYMGHLLSEKGISPLAEKLESLRMAEAPKNVSQLRSFLGLVNYYGKFVKGLSMKLHPLFSLLNQEVKWNWSKECEAAFQWAKIAISNDDVMIQRNLLC